MARFYCPMVLVTGQSIDLPTTAARHVQVLRMQPGQALTLFNGDDGEFMAEVTHMGRSDVRVKVGAHIAVEREAFRPVHLVVGMPANERMDWLVEKATELGVRRITPVMSERSVVRLNAERAEKKQAHWQAIAISACEQCGRNQVPHIDVPERLDVWWQRLKTPLVSTLPVGADAGTRTGLHLVLSLHGSTHRLSEVLAADRADTATDRVDVFAQTTPVMLLTGPEGGLSDDEDATARQAGFKPISLGQRVLRSETAALAALAYLELMCTQ